MSFTNGSALLDTVVLAVVSKEGTYGYKITQDVRSVIDISESTILADKAYGTKEILDYIQRQDGDYAIPPKSNTRNSWKCDWVLYKERHLIECFFLKLKQFRRVATRYDKLATSFLAFIYIAAISILLK